MSKKKRKTENDESQIGRILAWTFLLSLTFSAGMITGQRLIRRDSMPPLVSVRTIAPTDIGSDSPEVKKLKTTFSFYEKLAQPEQKKEVLEASEKPTPKPIEKPKQNKPDPVKVEKPEEKPDPEPKIDPEPVEQAPAAIVVKEIKEIIKPPAENKALPARYTLQVSSHPTKKAASKALARLKAMGYEASVIAIALPEKGTMFRVRIGKFHSMDEAREFQGDLKQSRGLPTFVTPL